MVLVVLGLTLNVAAPPGLPPESWELGETVVLVLAVVLARRVV